MASPSEFAPEQLLDVLRWRRAVRFFDPERVIEGVLWDAIEQSLVLTPSSYGMQPWRFLVITDRALREKLVGVCYGQRQVADCSHLVILCARSEVTRTDIEALLELMSRTHGVERDALAGYEKLLISNLEEGMDVLSQRQWARNQVYLALGQLLLAAALHGVDACPIEGFQAAGVERLLGMEGSGYHASVLAALGYRSEHESVVARAKVRFPRDWVVQRFEPEAK